MQSAMYSTADWLPVATSGLPSWLKSPTTTVDEYGTPVWYATAVWNVASPFPRSTSNALAVPELRRLGRDEILFPVVVKVRRRDVQPAGCTRQQCRGEQQAALVQEDVDARHSDCPRRCRGIHVPSPLKSAATSALGNSGAVSSTRVSKVKSPRPG